MPDPTREFRGCLDRPIVDERSMWRSVDLFYGEFMEGEDIVVETDDGTLYVGRLIRTREDDYLIMQISTKRRVEIDWHEIVFVAHAGFPVRAIANMTPAQAEDFAKQFDTERCRNVILELLQRDTANPASTATVTEKPRPDRIPSLAPRVRLRGGCPFDFDDVEIVALNNPGHDSPAWWGSGNEEELVLRARDGATCLSYNLGHLFYLETDRVTMGVAS